MDTWDAIKDMEIWGDLDDLGESIVDTADDVYSTLTDWL